MNFLSGLIPKILKDKVKRSSGAPDMFWSIQNMKTNGFCPNRIIDIGAYTGEWTLSVKNIFPNAHFLMIEPQGSKRENLEKVCIKNTNVCYCNNILGASSGKTIIFHEMETASSVLTEHHDVEAKLTNKITATLDQVADQYGFKNTEFIKLDTQGYELEILKGGINMMSKAECILMEVNLIDIHQQCPLLHDAVMFMNDHGFLAYDICSFTRRPLDKALWQTDMIFVKNTSKLRASKRYQ